MLYIYCFVLQSQRTTLSLLFKTLALASSHNHHTIIKTQCCGWLLSALSNCFGAFAIALVIRICVINVFDCTEVNKTRVVQHSDRVDVDLLKKYLLLVNNSRLLIAGKSHTLASWVTTKFKRMLPICLQIENRTATVICLFLKTFLPCFQSPQFTNNIASFDVGFVLRKIPSK